MPFQGIGTRISLLWHKDIWQASLLSDRSPRGRFYALLRVVSISATSFFETKTLSRAADLSFSSMLGLGPLIAIAMLVASTVLGERNPNLAADALNRVITFVAPQLNQYENPNNGGAVAVNPQLVALIDGFIKGARSDAVGVVGGLMLVVIVLFLFKSIEDAFNEIWGVRRGRALLTRVVLPRDSQHPGPVGRGAVGRHRGRPPALGEQLARGSVSQARAPDQEPVRFARDHPGSHVRPLCLLALRPCGRPDKLRRTECPCPQQPAGVGRPKRRQSRAALPCGAHGDLPPLSRLPAADVGLRALRGGEGAHPGPQRVPEPDRRPGIRDVRAAGARCAPLRNALSARAALEPDHAAPVQGGSGQPGLRARQVRPRQDGSRCGRVRRRNGAPGRAGVLPQVGRGAHLGGAGGQIKRCQCRGAP